MFPVFFPLVVGRASFALPMHFSQEEDSFLRSGAPPAEPALLPTACLTETLACMLSSTLLASTQLHHLADVHDHNALSVHAHLHVAFVAQPTPE